MTTFFIFSRIKLFVSEDLDTGRDQQLAVVGAECIVLNIFEDIVKPPLITNVESQEENIDACTS
jgi:hypothetical protein